MITLSNIRYIRAFPSPSVESLISAPRRVYREGQLTANPPGSEPNKPIFKTSAFSIEKPELSPPYKSHGDYAFYDRQIEEESYTPENIHDPFLTQNEMNKLRMRLNIESYYSLVNREFGKFQRKLSEFKKHGIPYDEVSYTLMSHFYIVSHRHASHRSLMVIDEMIAANMHPAIINLNKSIIEGILDCAQTGVNIHPTAYINLITLAWHVSIRLIRKRRRRIISQLQELSSIDLAELVAESRIGNSTIVTKLAREEHANFLPIDKATDWGLNQKTQLEEIETKLIEEFEEDLKECDLFEEVHCIDE